MAVPGARMYPVQVHTRSMDIILAPIASRVSQLLILSQSASNVVSGTPPSGMQAKLSTLQAAMVELASAAERTVGQFNDDKLTLELPQACEKTTLAGHKIVETANKMCTGRRALNGDQLAYITASSQELMVACFQVLVVWEAAEVRKIVDAANLLLDRLHLVEVSKSMRGLLICLKGFSEPLLVLLALLDKRLKELTSPDTKRNLLANLDDLKQCIPKLTASMQTCIRNPHDSNAKHFCNFYVTEVERTVGEIIAIVQKTVPIMSTTAAPVKVVFAQQQQPLTRAATVEKAQVQLTSSLRYSDNSDLEHNINTVLHNSMAVAHVSRDVLRNKITQLCTEVEVLYKEFKQKREMLAVNPTSAKLKAGCDGKAEELTDRLLLLEKTVQEAVVDQVSDAFVGTSAPLDHLITATGTAAAGQSSSEDSDDDHDLSNKVTLFRKHSRRLSQVAINAAEGATDPSVAQHIKHTADQVERLAPQVASAALFAHNNPGDQHAQQHLSLVKDEWTAKVKQLTTAVDQVTDAQDLLAASEVMIREDMARCRDAIQRGDLRDVQATVAAVERRCRRLIQLARNELKTTEDPAQSYTLTTTISKMENALSHMLSTCATLLSNVHDVSAQKALAGSLKQLVTLAKELKQALAMKKATKSVATSTPLPVSRPVVSSRGTHVATSHVTSQDTPYISMQSSISPIQHSSHQQAPLKYSTPIERSLGPYSPATPSYVKTTALKRSPSYGEHSHGYSKSYVTGDAETQTALPRMRDQNLQTQVDHQVSYSTTPVMVDVSSSTTNLFDQTHCTVALQTDTDLLTDASINIDPHGPYAAYVLPGQRLVSATLGGDADTAEEQISEVQSRVNKLVEMGQQIVTTCPEDGHLIREIRDTISNVNQLTKTLLAQAVDLLSDSEDLAKAEQLKETGREWADCVQALAAAVEKGSQPWGKPPSRLAAEAAKGGSQLEYEIKYVNHQTEQLVDVAMTTVQAIEADKKEHDADTASHVQIVRVTASEIAKLAPVLIKTAREASSNRSSMESLNLISQEWATNAKLLVHSVDAITDPPTSTVDYLAISAKSGDPQLFADQVNNIQTLTTTLQEIAHNATMGCSNPEVIKIVTVTGRKIEKLSAQLVECAKDMTKASDATEHDTAMEQFTLVKHKWNSNLQLLTTHVDELISRMAAPLSKLVGIAVAISKTQSEATKQHLTNQFAGISDHLTQHAGTVETTFDQAVSGAHKDSTVNSAGGSIKILRKLTPHSIAAARSLSDDQSLAVVEHFQHLRRQWAAKAQSLYTQLTSITSVDMTPVLAAFEEMIGASLSNGTTSSPMPRAQSSANMSPSPRARQADTSQVVKRKSHSSSERPITIAVPQEATPSFNSITAAAWSLHQEADQFMSDGNPIISTAKEMSQQMRHLAEYSKGRGIIETKEQMIDAAKEIASSAMVIVDYAKKIAQQCTDSRMKYTLEQSAELIPTLGTQLTIIATVKASSAPSDISADVMLVKNAQNLMEAVIKTMREAEAACMKGLKPSDDPEELEAAALALSWKKNLYRRRNMESVRAPVGKKGLRRMDKAASTSSMVDIIEKARTSIGSPPKH